MYLYERICAFIVAIAAALISWHVSYGEPMAHANAWLALLLPALIGVGAGLWLLEDGIDFLGEVPIVALVIFVAGVFFWPLMTVDVTLAFAGGTAAMLGLGYVVVIVDPI